MMPKAVPWGTVNQCSGLLLLKINVTQHVQVET